MSEIEKIRDEFRPKFPERITTLFVGESPPRGGTFFYDLANLSKLFCAMRKAFEAAQGKDFKSERAFLDYFKECGFYLDDLVHEPINHLGGPIRRRMRRASVQKLADSIGKCNPQCIVILMFAIEQDVMDAIQNANLENYPTVHCVPFPANGHQRCFRELMERIIPSLPTDTTKMNGKKST
jgi:hypothetical protein